jgi:predicted GNAT family acetyltransferase
MFEQGELTSACWSGANLIPVGPCSDAALDAFASRAKRSGVRYSSMFGEAEPVLGLWSRLQAAGWRARDVRACQPLFATDRLPEVAADPLVGRAGPDDLLTVLPASVAMFTEEVGYSPMAADGGLSYRRRVAELLRQGRMFVRRDGDGVVFKADLGSVSSSVAQVHGVWVDPRYRGQGIAAPAMAAVVAAALRSDARTISLYVNDYNHRALAVYAKVGFTQVGTFATVLF